MGATPLGLAGDAVGGPVPVPVPVPVPAEALEPGAESARRMEAACLVVLLLPLSRVLSCTCCGCAVKERPWAAGDPLAGRDCCCFCCC